MGCSKPQTMFSIISVENQELIRYENSWKVKEISIQELEGISRRSSTASLSKLLRLINSQFSLSIPSDLFDGSTISHADFLTFFILLGKGSAKDKNTALWYLYDADLEETLDKATFSRLIKSVIKVSVEVSLKYYRDKHNAALITSWHQQLSERKESLEVKLLKHFLGDTDNLTYELFMTKCGEMPLGMISELSCVRTQLEHTQVIPKRFMNPFKSMKVTKLSD